MKRTLEHTWNKWKARIRIFVCSLTTLCMLTYWFFKARPHIFACCMLAIYFLLLVFEAPPLQKRLSGCAGLGLFSKHPDCDLPGRRWDMVLEYTREYNENAVMNKCLTPIAK